MKRKPTSVAPAVLLLAMVFFSLNRAFADTDERPRAEPAPRDSLFNASWRFYCEDMRHGGLPVSDWKWMRADPGVNAKTLAEQPLPGENEIGWQPYQPGQAVFKDQAGFIWMRATLPASPGPHRKLHVSAAAPRPQEVRLVDGQLGLGIAIKDQTVTAFLNGQPIGSQYGGDFDLDLDNQWRVGDSNVLVLLVGTTTPTPTSPLASASLADFPEATEFKTAFDDSSWPLVNLPHWDRLETYDTARPYQGIAWYRKILVPGPEMTGKRVTLEFEGVMQVADVWVNGEHRLTHYGGYLPFTIDLSNDITAQAPLTIAVKVDSRDNNLVPPGKPISGLDFEYYNGIYRNVRLHITSPLHITDAIVADKPAGGGILVSYPLVSKARATVQVQTEVANETAREQPVSVAMALIDATGREVATVRSQPQTIAQNSSSTFSQQMTVTNPLLWHPDHPNLYRLRVTVAQGTLTADEQTLRVGIRTVALDQQNGFLINGEKLMLFGANRHQYYPWVGGAVSDNAQYRDLWKLKSAGWNFVRLAHYPQSPAVMNACDELGLIAIVCNPGWQYWKDDAIFWSRMEQAIREMVRWHRNHPSAVFWEVTINEAYAPKTRVNQWHHAVHEELPGDQTFTTGDTREYARTQGKIVTADPAGVELDVPYPAWNSGEPIPPDVSARKRMVREFVGATRDHLEDGDAVLLLGADQRLTRCAYWLNQPSICALAFWNFADYLRGYSPVNSGRGAVDMARLPKFTYFAFQSQRDPNLVRPDIDSGPMAFIANYWTPTSPHDIVVYSNCDEIELLVNGKSVGRHSPDKAALPHPPFTFIGTTYSPGELKAVGYIGGRPVVTTSRTSPQTPTRLKLSVDDSRRPWAADGADEVFVHASVLDENGTVVPDAKVTIQFKCEGEAQIVSEDSRPALGGIATILVRSGLQPGPIILSAHCPGLLPDSLTTLTARGATN